MANGDALGTKTESIADDILGTDGFVKHDSKFGSNHGFDGVYIKHDANGNVQEIIINEAKQIGTAGNIKLNGVTVNKGPQMSDLWVRQTIEEMRSHPTSSISDLGTVLFNNPSKIRKTVFGVDKATQEMVILKLSGY